MRLSEQTQGALPPHVQRPGYDVAAQGCGIVHIGIGAFHRAHQAVYTDDAMAAGDRDWRIVGISLRSGDVAAQINPQDGLYTLSRRAPDDGAMRLIGAVSHVLVAPQAPQAVIAALAALATHIVSFTVTEKGYLSTPDGGLDIEAPALAADLAGTGAPRTIYGFLAAAFARRKAAGLPGVTLLSCDNLAENGTRLATLLRDYLHRVDPALVPWFDTRCTCPNTMIDRIVPATTAADLDALEQDIGLRDDGAVVTEPFRQWVIEDRFAGPRPRWEAGGAQLVADVRPYEAAKLRMLNGAHSALAYLGLARGHAYVHQAIADPALRPIVERLMRQEAAATLDPVSGLDPQAYADALLTRFANSALPHRLIQIAMDGSQKIPQRWLEPLAINRAAARACPATLEALAAWIVHVRGNARPVDDPMAAPLAALWQQAGPAGIADALFGPAGLFARNWTAASPDIAALSAKVAAYAAQ